MKYQLKHEKIEKLIKYQKISIDGYIFLNFVSQILEILWIYRHIFGYFNPWLWDLQSPL